MLDKKTYDTLRKAQFWLYAFVAAWGVFCNVIDVGQVGVWVVAITGAAGAFLSHALGEDSTKYFSNKDIVEKEESK